METFYFIHSLDIVGERDTSNVQHSADVGHQTTWVVTRNHLTFRVLGGREVILWGEVVISWETVC